MKLAGPKAETLLDALETAFPRADWSELRDAKLGIDVVVKPVKRRHSESQRGYYWAMLREFGETLGYDARESEIYLHEEILRRAFGTKDIRRIGAVTVLLPQRRSHSCDIDEYGTLIDTLIRVAAEMGHPIEDPR